MGIINIARKFMDKMNNDNIGAFSAQASFFLFLSLFPCLILLLTLIQYTPITKAFLLETLVQIAPKNTTPVIITILDEMFDKSSTTLISFSVISALWSAGKGFFAITKGINVIYKKQENRNYFLLRLISGFYTLIFIILLVISLVLLVTFITICLSAVFNSDQQLNCYKDYKTIQVKCCQLSIKTS